MQITFIYYSVGFLSYSCVFVLSICVSMFISHWIYVYDVHPSVRVRACAAVRTACWSRQVRPVMRRQTVRKRQCVQASPRSAPSQAPKKTSQSAVRAHVSAWTGWGSLNYIDQQASQFMCWLSYCFEMNRKKLKIYLNSNLYIWFAVKEQPNNSWKSYLTLQPAAVI